MRLRLRDVRLRFALLFIKASAPEQNELAPPLEQIATALEDEHERGGVQKRLEAIRSARVRGEGQGAGAISYLKSQICCC
jgi:hypothetical protein